LNKRDMMTKRDVTKNLGGIPQDRIVVSPNGIEIVSMDDKESKHTEDIQEIITKVPSWIVRWGIALIFSTIFIIVAISILVPYPNTVNATLKLKSIGYTVPVIADTPGHIIKVFVKQDMIVKKGQPLLEIRKDTDQKPYIIKAPRDGRVGFSTVVQANTVIDSKQEIFKIHPLNEQFFGVMRIPKTNINDIKIGQDVLIKQAGASLGNTDVIKGKVDFVPDEPVNNQFIVKVVFTNPVDYRKRNLKGWMDFEGQIITKKSNLFLKLFGGIANVYNTI
jgi:hypothetical protein